MNKVGNTLPVKTRGLSLARLGNPNRAWSLLDVLNTTGTRFVEIAAIFSNNRALIHDGYASGRFLPASEVDSANKAALVKALRRVKALCSELGAAASVEAAKNFIEMLQPPYLPTWGQVVLVNQTTHQTFYGEIKRYRLLAITDDSARLMAARYPFGTLFATQFQDAQEDVREAARCLALERWGATVFHLLRVAERPLKAVLLPLGITGMEDKPWGSIIEKIEAEIIPDQHIQPISARQWSREEAAAVRTIVGYMQPLKEIRNERVMHGGAPLPDMDTAKNLYRYVEIFARETAKRLDAHGTFTP